MKSAARAVALVAMAGTLCASFAFADEPAKEPAPKNAPNATPKAMPSATSNAMRVVVDPETGEVRAPTDDELKAQLQRERAAASAPSSLARSSRAAVQSTHVLPAEKVVQHHANGMVSVRMSQESLSMLKAKTNSNGAVKITHEGETSEHVAAEEK
jgi:hypothetical protein